MHPALPQAFRSFLEPFVAQIPAHDLEAQNVQNASFIAQLESNDYTLRGRYPAYEVWPIDAQVGLHAVAWRMGPKFLKPEFRTALTSALLPDFDAASIESACKNCTLNWNLAVAKLFKNAASVLRHGVNPNDLYYRPKSLFGFEKANEVEKVATPVSTQEFLNALSQVFQQIENVRPDIKQLGMLYGQWALETNTGKSMFNNAVGNVKITDNQMNSGLKFFSQFTGDSGVLRPDGVIGEGVNHFRAYDTLSDGIRSWLGLLKAPRYRAGWEALKNGDAVGFATGIARGGYVAEPSQDSYIKGVLSRNADFIAKVAPTLQITNPSDTGNSPSAPLSNPIPTKVKVAVGIGTLAALGTVYLMVHPLAAISTAVAARSVYKEGKEFFNPTLTKQALK